MHADAYSWFIANDPEWPYSFCNVCRVLRLSTEAVLNEVWADAESTWYSHSRRIARSLGASVKISLSALFTGRRAQSPAESDHESLAAHCERIWPCSRSVALDEHHALQLLDRMGPSPQEAATVSSLTNGRIHVRQHRCCKTRQILFLLGALLLVLFECEEIYNLVTRILIFGLGSIFVPLCDP
jgi:hypothetical protein